MKKFSKLIALALACVMALTVLTGCSVSGTGGKVYGTISSGSADKPNIGGVEIRQCKVSKTDSYTGEGELIAVTLSVVNNSKAPLEMEHTLAVWTSAILSGSYDSFFANGSKYFTVAADSKKIAKICAYGIRTSDITSGNPDFENTTLKPGDGAAVQLVIQMPKGWKNLNVQWKPSSANGKSVAFHFTPSDVK